MQPSTAAILAFDLPVAIIIAKYLVEKHLAGQCLNDPFILLDACNKILLWYIPECLTEVRQVSFDIYYAGHNT